MSLLLLFHPRATSPTPDQDIDGQNKKSKRRPKPPEDDMLDIIAALLPIINGE